MKHEHHDRKIFSTNIQILREITRKKLQLSKYQIENES